MWSWVLAIVGSTGLFFVGEKRLRGWFILAANEILWCAYAIHTHQYGFIAYSALYLIMYYKAIRNWK